MANLHNTSQALEREMRLAAAPSLHRSIDRRTLSIGRRNRKDAAAAATSTADAIEPPSHDSRWSRSTLLTLQGHFRPSSIELVLKGECVRVSQLI